MHAFSAVAEFVYWVLVQRVLWDCKLCMMYCSAYVMTDEFKY